MKINNRTSVSRGHRGCSHGFRHLTPGGALSGIDEEDASPAGTGGASGGARSGANTGAPQREQPNTTTTLCRDGRTLRSSSSSVCATYLYQNHKRRQLLQHLTSTASSCVQRCLASHPHASHTTAESYHQSGHSSRVLYHREKHTHTPKEDLGESHNPEHIGCCDESENTGTAQVSHPLTTAVWKSREADINKSTWTGAVSNKSSVDRLVDNSSVNCATSNGADAGYKVPKVTTSPAETVVSSAAQGEPAGGATPAPSGTCLTNGHGITELAVQSHPVRWAALGTLPREVTEPHTLYSRDISIQDLCIEETSDNDDVFAPDEPVLLSGPDKDRSLRPLGELGDSCNQKLGGHTVTCLHADYGSLISGERPVTVGGSIGGAGGQAPAMFSRYRSSSVPDHTFRQRDLGLLQTSVTSQISDTGAGEIRTVNMPGGALTTIVGAASAPAPSSETNREHAQLAPGCIDARPSTCPPDGSAGGVRPFPVAQSNTTLRLGTLPQQGNAPEVGLTPPEDCDVPLPVRIPSAFSPHGGHYTPRRRELVRLSPLPVSPRTTEPLETIGGAAARLSSSSSTAEHGFRPISPTRGAISNPTLHSTVVDSLPLPGSRYSRTPSPTLSVRSLSPGPYSRQRSNTFSGSGLIRGDLHSFLSPPRSPARLPRDAHQPSKGSISDLSDKQGSAEEAGEEADSFHFRPFQRQRSSTCPENRAWRRRKAAAANRPPTPPPIGGSGSRGSSPRGSLGETSRTVAGALVTLTPNHLTRRSDLSDLREDQDQADDVADSAATGESPVPGDQTQTRHSQNGTAGNGTGDDSSQGLALMERLCLQNEAPTETNSNLGIGQAPPGSLPALRH